LLADRENGPLRGVYDVKVDGDTLLVVGPANPLGEALHGALVVDVSDPANPEEVSFFGTDYPIHNAYLRDGYAYLTANDWERNPIVVVDVSGSNPEEVGRWSILDRDEAWGDVPAGVRTVHDVHVQDDVAYLVHWDAGTWLLDVSDPSNPTYLADFRGQSIEELASVDGQAAA
ncbi:LVIVD repeat-containing protein, partial [Halobium palmae]